jgi:hypothetical protein
MVLLRANAHSDLEVSMRSTPGGIRYDIYNEETKSNVKDLSAMDAYASLTSAFQSNTVRLPAKFVIEFAEFVIADLSAKLSVK